MIVENPGGSGGGQYVFDNAASQAGARFKSLATLYDGWTARQLGARGVGNGWNCLEVGGGDGSVAVG